MVDSVLALFGHGVGLDVGNRSTSTSDTHEQTIGTATGMH